MLFQHTLMSPGLQMDYWKDSYMHRLFLRLLYSSWVTLLHNYFFGTNSDVVTDVSKLIFSSANLHTNQFFPSQKDPPDLNINY